MKEILQSWSLHVLQAVQVGLHEVFLLLFFCWHKLKPATDQQRFVGGWNKQEKNNNNKTTKNIQT